MAEWYYRAKGEDRGPVPLEPLRQLVEEGSVGPGDTAREDGQSVWRPVRNIPELSGALELELAEEKPRTRPSARIGAAAVSPSVSAAGFREPERVKSDPGPFMHVGGSVAYRSQWYDGGRVVASPKAIYILRGTARKRSNAMRAGIAGGAIGGAIAGLVEHAREGDEGDDLRTCAVSELPEPVRPEADPSGRLEHNNAIVLTRESVKRVKMSMGFLKVASGSEEFEISMPPFKGKQIRQFLEQNGRRLGVELTPTAPKTFGDEKGRRRGEVPAAGRTREVGTLEKVVTGIVVTILTALLIYLKIRHAMRR